MRISDWSSDVCSSDLGLATTSAVLSYVGRPFDAWREGKPHRVYGWHDTHSENYPELGLRWFGNCDIPDLALFPSCYPSLRPIRFAARSEERRVGKECVSTF